MKGYWENGHWKADVPYSEGVRSLESLAEEVADAVQQAKAGTDAGLLLKVLFNRHPQLRSTDWDDENSTHPLAPLVGVFATQRVRGLTTRLVDRLEPKTSAPTRF